MRALRTSALLVCLTGLGAAQTAPPSTTPAAGTAPATAPAPAEPAPAADAPWSLGPINFSGLVDGYYSLNFNHPESRNNNLRNFDAKANQFSLNMAKLTLEHAPEPIGFRVDLGFGRAFDIFHFNEKDIGVMRNIMQAYLSVKPKNAKGLQIDFGKFVTSAGAELTETHLNWNYSRAFLFANGPYYHFGLRTSMPLNKYFTAGFQLVNGWNNVEDNNSGKTIGLTGAFTLPKGVTWSHAYYMGPEKTNTNQGYRNFYDTVLLVAPNPKANFYLNFDYGTEKLVTRGSNDWVAIGGAARFQVNEWFALSPRAEYYYDKDGFITGTAQKLKEFTMTAEVKMKQGFLTRLEYRRDWSDQPYFDRGNGLANHKNMDTLLVGFVAFFGPK